MNFDLILILKVSQIVHRIFAHKWNVFINTYAGILKFLDQFPNY